MKNFLLLLFLLLGTFTFAQSNCKVLKTEISGRYKGKCKKGFAHGKGVAKGTDTYSGQFRSGVPAGRGEYTYATGEKYVGEFAKGLRHGKGKYYFTFNEKDTVTVGIWEEDVYAGPVPPDPYEVKVTRSIERYTIRKISEEGEQVNVKFKQSGMPNVNVSGYREVVSSGMDLFLNNAKAWENMEFPFKCTIAYDTPNKLKTGTYRADFSFIINEPGTWEVILHN